MNLPLTLSQAVQIDAAPRPVAYWAELWGRTPGTVIRWIQEGTCPARKIGGVYMISVLDVLNWEPDGETSGGPREGNYETLPSGKVRLVKMLDRRKMGASDLEDVPELAAELQRRGK